MTTSEESLEDRRTAMQILANTGSEKLEASYNAFPPKPEWTFVRAPETGLVMVRGKIGGGGAPFNLGEMTVTRSTVTLETGEVGHAYVAGRDRRKAAIAAFFDAAYQNPDLKPIVRDRVLGPLGRALLAADQKTAEQAAATKVDFFTMVRGED